VAFTGVAVTSFGGPLALAALYGPGIVAGAHASAGFVLVAAAVVFAFPLTIWLRYSREIQSSGGLYAFTEAAVGRPAALVQAGLWIVSYLLYLLYTTAQIVYDTLPVVFPGVVRYQPLLEIAIPAAIAAVLIAGRRVTLLLTGILAAGQLAIAADLAVVTMAHLDTPLSSFGPASPAGSVAIASAQAALLYICGSLPFFLGGEVGTAQEATIAAGDRIPDGTAGTTAGLTGDGDGQPPAVRPSRPSRAARTIRGGVLAAYLATALVMVAAVAPLAAEPVFTRLPLPGMSVAQAYAGRGFAVIVGIGVAASIAGVIAVEYLALSRLASAVTGWPRRPVLIVIGVAMVAFAPVTLISPDEIYGDLLTPSLVALWLSQLIVFAVYPRFAARQRTRTRRLIDHPVPAWTLAATAAALAVYGAYSAITQAGT
jgi:amino acid transporter